MIPRTKDEKVRLALGIIRLENKESILNLSDDSNKISISSTEKYAVSTSFTITEDGQVTNSDYMLNEINIFVDEINPAGRSVARRNLHLSLINSTLLQQNTINSIIEAIIDLDRKIEASAKKSAESANILLTFAKKFKDSFVLILKSFGYSFSEESIMAYVKIYCNANQVNSISEAIDVMCEYTSRCISDDLKCEISKEEILHYFNDNSTGLEEILSRVAVFSNSASAVASGRRPDWLGPLRNEFRQKRKND